MSVNIFQTEFSTVNGQRWRTTLTEDELEQAWQRREKFILAVPIYPHAVFSSEARVNPDQIVDTKPVDDEE